MKILDSHPTAQALYAGVLENPGGDTERLILADCLQESDDPKLIDLATFIRAQFELDRIGPPRYQVESATISRRGGPDYYEFIDGDGEVLKPGVRFDLIPYTSDVDRRQGKVRPTIHGLVVVRTEPDFEGDLRIIAKKDADSVPYPAERRAALIQTAAHLWADNWLLWWRPEDCVPTRGGPDSPHFGWWSISPVPGRWGMTAERGFPDRYTGSWDYWRNHGPLLTKKLPITHVTLRERPHLYQAAMPEVVRVFYFSGVRAGGKWVSRSRKEIDNWGTLTENSVIDELLRKTWPSVIAWCTQDLLALPPIPERVKLIRYGQETRNPEPESGSTGYGAGEEEAEDLRA